VTDIKDLLAEADRLSVNLRDYDDQWDAELIRSSEEAADLLEGLADALREAEAEKAEQAIKCSNYQFDLLRRLAVEEAHASAMEDLAAVRATQILALKEPTS
jgi:hypothetical protein